MSSKPFANLKKLAQNIRDFLGDKKCYLLFAYNGTGKTRLSCAFKDLGKKAIHGSEEKTADTLYYNAFTEDLFTWNNDLPGDTERELILNMESRFLQGIIGLEMESRISKFLDIHADFSFRIHTDTYKVVFSREVRVDDLPKWEHNIKISRGEERIFVWCFFLAIVELAMDKEVDYGYDWVKFIYIDDPISSLDDNNVVAVACQLARLIRNSDIKTVVSTHHALFFNVMFNELNKDSTVKRFLSKNTVNDKYITRDTKDTPFFHHVAMLIELKKAADSGNIYKYHFNILRGILEKTASFHGYDKFSACIKQDATDLDGAIHLRMSNLLSHEGYSLFEPDVIDKKDKEHFKNIIKNFLKDYNFNKELFEDDQIQEVQQ